MGNPREALRSFLHELERSPQELKEKAKEGIPFTYRTTISAKRFDSSVETVEVRGQLDPYYGDPVVYSVPSFNLEVAGHFGEGHTPRLYKPLNSFVSELGGDEVEVDTSMDDSRDKLEPKFWSKWKEGSLGRIYRELVYPRTVKEIEERSDVFGSGRIVGVDLFGGDGEFAQMLASTLTSGDRLAEIHVVDADSASLDAARYRANYTHHGIVMVHPPVDLTTEEDIFPDTVTSPSLVTAIGGLCANVINRDEALSIAEKVFYGLNEGSIFAVSGYTPIVLNANDFKRIGFIVENMSVPPNVLSFTTPYQMYILRK